MFYYDFENYCIACEQEAPSIGGILIEMPNPGKRIILGKHFGNGHQRDLVPTSIAGRPILGIEQLFRHEGEESVPLVNLDSPQWMYLLEKSPEKLRINLLGLGDVGSHLLIGLKLLGQEIVESIGIYDLNPKQIERFSFEVNQIYSEAMGNEISVVGVDLEDLFECDVFVFTASAFIPPVDVVDQDVRMAQFESNAKIMKHYAKLARDRDFKGVFAVVSDPVDLLCQVVYDESNKNDLGISDYRGLSNFQIVGFGLGVMHARARYFAKLNPALENYLIEGAIYGPHGRDLVVLNSAAAYDEALSTQLTQLTVSANLKVRELGFKPFIAPAYSSGALSLIAFLKGEKAHVATYLDGVFFGAKCWKTPFGIVYDQIKQDERVEQLLKKTRDALLKLYGGA